MTWMSIPQLAKHIGRDVSSNLVRRYIQRFPFFFVGQAHAGVMKYPPEALDILKRIYRLYHKDKKSRQEIEDILYHEYGNTTTIIQGPDRPQNERFPVALGESSMPQILSEISRLANAFDRIASALERMPVIGSPGAATENQSIQDKEILTDAETAIYLGLSKRTLREWRHKSKGPSFIRIGVKIRYKKSDIMDYLKKNISVG